MRPVRLGASHGGVRDVVDEGGGRQRHEVEDRAGALVVARGDDALARNVFDPRLDVADAEAQA